MKFSQNLAVIFFNLLLIISLIHCYNDGRKSYIVYMGDLPGDDEIPVEEDHHNLLVSVIGDESIARKSRIHSYKKSFNGFVAKLLTHEARKMEEKDRVISVFENTRNKLHTTRSWDFLGFTESVKRIPKLEGDIIVGLMDSGIYAESPSFSDNGFGPPPAKWKGKCMTGANFTGCNKKVIGAKYFNLEKIDIGDQSASPADDDGHGTHTSSTVGGVAVQGASLYGIGKGTARGGVPSARIAMYKVCWLEGCSDMDMLAAFDDAIADGVDIISVSIGGEPRSFLRDPIAIGSFHATKKGILTSCSAGNAGPSLSTVDNNAPWIMTVAASTIDRQFQAAIKLGNGFTAKGISINTFSQNKMYPLISGTLASNLTGDQYGNASACDIGTLSKNKVEGKIVYCLDNAGQDATIKKLKGIGMINSISSFEDTAFTAILPATSVNLTDGYKIDQYINSTQNPQAIIYKTEASMVSAPALASFSSRGPQVINLNILKPDLTAPGVDILAAYSKLASITGLPNDKRYQLFNIISGTSMACPHAAAAAAYVKSFHPDWSPSAIKSALMTTATPMKIKDMDTDLGSGSGQIDPLKAVNPGLIYDLSMSSYLSFLCKEGYNSTTIGLLLGGKKKYNCSSFKPAKGTDGLNYPSMHMQITNNRSNVSAIFYRTVTNVGYANSVYKVSIKAPKQLKVKVEPESLTFSSLKQKREFKVMVKIGQMPDETESFSALLEWTYNKFSVKSPIIICKQIWSFS